LFDTLDANSQNRPRPNCNPETRKPGEIPWNGVFGCKKEGIPLIQGILRNKSSTNLRQLHRDQVQKNGRCYHRAKLI
jgi:hypothetical protein